MARDCPAARAQVLVWIRDAALALDPQVTYLSDRICFVSLVRRFTGLRHILTVRSTLNRQISLKHQMELI